MKRLVKQGDGPLCMDESCLNFACYVECTPSRCSKSCGNQRIR